jgi:hypothetical protein
MTERKMMQTGIVCHCWGRYEHSIGFEYTLQEGNGAKQSAHPRLILWNDLGSFAESNKVEKIIDFIGVVTISDFDSGCSKVRQRLVAG